MQSVAAATTTCGEILAKALHDFDAFGDQLSFKEGEELTLINYAPTTTKTWCMAKKKDGKQGLVLVSMMKIKSEHDPSVNNNSDHHHHAANHSLSNGSGSQLQVKKGTLFGKQQQQNQESIHPLADDKKELEMHKKKQSVNAGAWLVGFLMVFLILLILAKGLMGLCWLIACLIPKALLLVDWILTRRLQWWWKSSAEGGGSIEGM